MFIHVIRTGEITYIIARRTSSIGMTPSFSPSIGSENKVNASLISASSCAVMSCSLASLDCLALVGGPDPAAAPDFRFGGCEECDIQYCEPSGSALRYGSGEVAYHDIP